MPATREAVSSPAYPTLRGMYRPNPRFLEWAVVAPCSVPAVAGLTMTAENGKVVGSDRTTDCEVAKGAVVVGRIGRSWDPWEEGCPDGGGTDSWGIDQPGQRSLMSNWVSHAR